MYLIYKSYVHVAQQKNVKKTYRNRSFICNITHGNNTWTVLNDFDALPWFPVLWQWCIYAFTCNVKQVFFSVWINAYHSCIFINL